MYIPHGGDIVAWNNESKCTSIAVMMNEDEFSVCLNFRGRKDEESRIWEWDNVPTDKALRRADKLEMAWLFAELIAQGYEFRAEDGKVSVNINMMESNTPDPDTEPEPDPEPEVQVRCVFLSRNDRFAKYVYELAKLYQQQGSFRNMSELARRNNITSIKKETCFRIGLPNLLRPEWLTSKAGIQYCNDLYEYALRHTQRLPLIPQSARK